MLVGALLAAACASPPPSATPVAPIATASPSIVPTSVATQSTATVRVGRWTATCSNLQEDDCGGVMLAFVQNLARSGGAVLASSGGKVAVAQRSACPSPLETYIDPTTCWQAWAAGPDATICMVIARSYATEAALPFAQVGGDDLSGRALGPPPGWPSCE